MWMHLEPSQPKGAKRAKLEPKAEPIQPPKVLVPAKTPGRVASSSNAKVSKPVESAGSTDATDFEGQWGKMFATMHEFRRLAKSD